MKMNWKKLYVTFMIALLSAFFVPAAAFADTTSEEVTNESTEEVVSEDTEQPEDVIANPILELKAKTIQLQKGKSFAASKLIKKMAEGDEVISWKSSKTKYATVSSKGVIKAKKPGTTKITITLKSGKSAKITVKVQKSAVKTKSIKLNKKKLSLKKNQTYTLKVTRTPYTTFDKITYTSSNPSVAKVSSKGKIKAVKPGTAKITVKSGKKKAVCTVTVKKTPLSQKQVYKDIMALKKKYPEGKKWTNDNYYEWKGGIYRGGYGCAGFAFLLSDAAFGKLPARVHTNFDKIKVGDIIRLYYDTHSVIVLEVKEDSVIVAEGNYNYSIHWGREISNYEIYETGVYVMTRYPK